VQIDKVSFTVTADADYTLNRESVVYGLITGVELTGLPRDAGLDEIGLVVSGVSDLPFAFRIRVDDDAVTIKDLKVGPFGSPLFAQLMNKNGDNKEGLFISAVVNGKYKADPNPDRDPLLIPQPAAAPPRRGKK
jgi:hypothetical protein